MENRYTSYLFITMNIEVVGNWYWFSIDLELNIVGVFECCLVIGKKEENKFKINKGIIE